MVTGLHNNTISPTGVIHLEYERNLLEIRSRWGHWKKRRSSCMPIAVPQSAVATW